MGDFDEAAETTRLRRLAALSQDQDVLLVELVWGGKWVRFDIASLELQHLSVDELWRRYLAPALVAVEAPRPVQAEAVVGVGEPS